MRCAWPVLAAGVLLLAGVSGRARAQDTTTTPTGTITIQLVGIGGQPVNTNAPRPISKDDCTEPTATIDFDVRNVPTQKTTLDLYIGTNCNQTNRNTPDASCTFVEGFEINGRKDFEVPVDAGKTQCPNGISTFWFLAVDSSQGGEEVGQDFGTLEVEFDTLPPAAPMNVEGGAGERTIPVTWETEEQENARFVVYIDNQASRGDDGSDGGVSADGVCSSSRLAAGKPAEDIPKSVPTKVIEERTATGIDLDPEDIDGDLAAVGVVAIDEAGNESELSEIACVELVPTEGFWERYESQGGTAETGCECRARAGAGRGGSGAAIGTALVLFALARTRRRRT